MSRPGTDDTSHDVIIVGGGHNGLVAALHLARAGCQVTVLERGTEPGGCVWTQRHESGVLVERGAFEHSGILAMATELGLTDPELGEAALRYHEHPVVAGFVFGDGERRVFHTDLERTVADLGADGTAYRELVDLASVLFDMLDTFDPPPTLTEIAATLAPLQGGDALFRTLLLPAETVIDTALEDRHTRAALALQAAHAQVPAWAPGTGMFALILPSSHAGPSVRPIGGSRSLIDALVAALEQEGVTIQTGAEVVRLSTGASGRGEVELDDGSVLAADAVISAIGLPRTAALLSDSAPELRAANEGLHSGHFNISEMTVTLVLDRPIDLGLSDPDAIWYAVDRPEDVRRGFGEVLAGQLPSSPWAMVAQVTQPADVAGSAIWMSSIVPLESIDGPWTVERERAAADRVIDQVASVLGVDLRQGVIDVVVSGPATWADRVGGDGNPNHIDNTIDQLLGWRAPGHGDMRTELDWLFLSGAGQHPGGGLSGAAGTAAAAAVLTPPGGGRGPVDRVLTELRGLKRGLAAYRTMRR